MGLPFTCKTKSGIHCTTPVSKRSVSFCSLLSFGQAMRFQKACWGGGAVGFGDTKDTKDRSSPLTSDFCLELMADRGPLKSCVPSCGGGHGEDACPVGYGVQNTNPRSSSREVRMSWYPSFSVVDFSGGTLLPNKGERALGDLETETRVAAAWPRQSHKNSLLVSLSCFKFRLVMRWAPFAQVGSLDSRRDHSTWC